MTNVCRNSAPALKKFAGELGEAAAKLDPGAATKTLKVFANIIETIADVLIWISTKGDAVIAWGVVSGGGELVVDWWWLIFYSFFCSFFFPSFFFLLFCFFFSNCLLPPQNIVKKVESKPLAHFNAFIAKVQTFALSMLSKIGCGPDGGRVPKWGVVLFEKVGKVLENFEMFKVESAWVKALSPCLSICQEKLQATTSKDAFAEVTTCVKSVGEEFAKLLNPCWYEGGETTETTETNGKTTTTSGTTAFLLEIESEISSGTRSETDTCAAQDIYFNVVDAPPNQEEVNDEAINEDVEFAASIDEIDADSPRKLTADGWTIGGVKFGAVSSVCCFRSR